MEFIGRVTGYKEVRKGEGKKGEWCSTGFELTESHPENEEYPQIAMFEMFKSGEYIYIAEEFKAKHPHGTEIKVTFNMQGTTYQKKDGSGEGKFYKNSVWSFEKLGGDVNYIPNEPVEESDQTDEDSMDLPF